MIVTERKLRANRANALKSGGRPVGSVQKSTIESWEARKIIIAFVTERLQPLLEAMYEKASKGDVLAFKELMDRSLGKATQAVEVSGKDGKPIVFMPLELIAKHALNQSEQEQPLHVESNVVESETKLLDVPTS